jgi:hypothetical protein
MSSSPHGWESFGDGYEPLERMVEHSGSKIPFDYLDEGANSPVPIRFDGN